QREAHQHHVSARACAVPRLLHGLYVRGIGLRLDCRRVRLIPGRFDDEVSATGDNGIRGAAPAHAASEATIVWPPAQLAYACDNAIALRIRIERRRCAHLHREVAAVLDRIDDDDLTSAHDTSRLHGAEADRSGAEDHDVG